MFSTDLRLWSLVLVLAACINTAHTTTPAGCQQRSFSTQPITAPGYEIQVVLTGLKSPRGIIFDANGQLLVVEQEVGISGFALSDNGSCIIAGKAQTIVSDSSLNHGIELSADSRTLYASSSESVYSWTYDVTKMRTTSDSTKIVTNMSNSDHVTRTLLLSKKVPGTLVVTRGSTSNIDPEAEQKSSGHSQIKAFNLTSRRTTYDFNSQGTLLGWGLRNDVGIDEHPVQAGIWSVENSVDQMSRDGQDIHQNNPGEELNFLGYLNGTDIKGGNYGYPTCYSAWDVSDIPQNDGITVGSQFAIGNATREQDEACRSQHVAPRLVFQAHMAPLDLLFNKAGSEAWVTFHGSWDRAPAVGYKLSKIEWNANDGNPTEPSTSLDAAIDIVTNELEGVCDQSASGCFRPVGLAWDAKGRLFMSSDATGEVFAITRNDGKAVDSSTSPTSTTASAAGSTSTSTGAAAIQTQGYSGLLGVVVAALLL